MLALTPLTIRVFTAHYRVTLPQRLVTFETFDQRDEKILLPTYIARPTYLHKRTPIRSDPTDL